MKTFGYLCPQCLTFETPDYVRRENTWVLYQTVYEMDNAETFETIEYGDVETNSISHTPCGFGTEFPAYLGAYAVVIDLQNKLLISDGEFWREKFRIIELPFSFNIEYVKKLDFIKELVKCCRNS